MLEMYLVKELPIVADALTEMGLMNSPLLRGSTSTYSMPVAEDVHACMRNNYSATSASGAATSSPSSARAFWVRLRGALAASPSPAASTSTFSALRSSMPSANHLHALVRVVVGGDYVIYAVRVRVRVDNTEYGDT